MSELPMTTPARRAGETEDRRLDLLLTLLAIPPRGRNDEFRSVYQGDRSQSWWLTYATDLHGWRGPWTRAEVMHLVSGGYLVPDYPDSLAEGFSYHLDMGEPTPPPPQGARDEPP